MWGGAGIGSLILDADAGPRCMVHELFAQPHMMLEGWNEPTV